jgi:hypothetical protein
MGTPDVDELMAKPNFDITWDVAYGSCHAHTPTEQTTFA